MCEEAGCEGLLEGGDSGEGCGVWEVEVGESHCCVAVVIGVPVNEVCR